MSAFNLFSKLDSALKAIEDGSAEAKLDALTQSASAKLDSLVDGAEKLAADPSVVTGAIEQKLQSVERVAGVASQEATSGTKVNADDGVAS